MISDDLHLFAYTNKFEGEYKGLLPAVLQVYEENNICAYAHSWVTKKVFPFVM